MKKILSLLALALIVQACNPDDETNTTTIVDNTSFETLVAPDDFNWSSSKSGEIEVNLIADPAMPIDLNGGLLYIRDANDNILAQEKIVGTKAIFQVNLPALGNNLKFFLPATGEEWPLEEVGSINLNLTVSCVFLACSVFVPCLYLMKYSQMQKF